MSAAQALIEASELAACLDDARTVVVDCRFRLDDPGAGREAYGRGHIPGARYAHLDHDLARAPRAGEGRHPLPEPEDFARTLGRSGIAPASRVVAYDDAGGAVAARLWWMLRWLGHGEARVLNGGLGAWREAGLPLSSALEPESPTQYAFTGIADGASVTTEALELLLEQGCALLDARAAARFRGEHEPIDPVAGHVPGASNLPFDACLGADGRFQRPEELRRVLDAALEGRDSAASVAMCGSGVTACHLLLAMEVAGLTPGRLYVGSWSEWIRDPTRPVARV